MVNKERETRKNLIIPENSLDYEILSLEYEVRMLEGLQEKSTDKKKGISSVTSA